MRLLIKVAPAAIWIFTTACTPAPIPAQPPQPYKSTAEIQGDDELHRLITTLAAKPVIESAYIEFDGHPSDVYAIFDRIQQRATHEQLLSLLFHESPVVRGYVALHILRAFPDEADAVAPLLADKTQVEVLEGCRGFHDTLGGVLVFELCAGPVKGARRQLLERAAVSPGLGDMAKRARECVGE